MDKENYITSNLQDLKSNSIFEILKKTFKNPDSNMVIFLNNNQFTIEKTIVEKANKDYLFVDFFNNRKWTGFELFFIKDENFENILSDEIKKYLSSNLNPTIRIHFATKKQLEALV